MVKKIYITKYSVLKGIQVFEAEVDRIKENEAYISFYDQGYLQMFNKDDATFDESVAKERFRAKVENELAKLEKRKQKLLELI